MRVCVLALLGPYRMLHANPFPLIAHNKPPRSCCRRRRKANLQAASISAFPEQQARPTPESPGLHQNPNPNSRPSPPPARRFWRALPIGKWPRDNESALNNCEPLPLPMTYPGSTPAPKDVETMKNCDPEIKDCRDVVYQWTGECSRCQGTGEISHYKKMGKEVICKCSTCLGLGHVHKMTLRTDVNIVEEMDVVS